MIALGAAGVALAGSMVVTDSDPRGSANGLTYRSADFGDASGGDYTVTTCPGSKLVSGGGAYAGGSAAEARLIESGPYPHPNADKAPERGSWTASIFNDNTGAPKVLTGYAICTSPRKVVRRVATRDGAAPGLVTASARCPAGSSVMGGGISQTSEAQARLLASAPLDGGDRDGRPDDGWRATSQLDALRDLVVYAVCQRGRRGKRLTYRTNRGPSETGISFVRARCPGGGAPTGGGARIDAPAGAFLNSSYPADLRADGVEFDGWSAWSYSATAQRLTTIVICRG